MICQYLHAVMVMGQREGVQDTLRLLLRVALLQIAQRSDHQSCLRRSRRVTGSRSLLRCIIELCSMWLYHDPHYVVQGPKKRALCKVNQTFAEGYNA